MSIHPRKRFGQHFLRDQRIIENIIAAINPRPEDFIVEIGPGLGALTKGILIKAHKLHVIEIDRDVIPELQKSCKNYGELIIHEKDVLDFNFADLHAGAVKQRIIGNLPYNISTPLLFHLLNFTALISDMTFMLQKEVAERMVAAPNSAAYGRLSIMVQYYCQGALLFLVPPSAFYPPPKVDSAIIRLQPYAQPPHKANDFSLFAEIVKTAFQYRRKTLQNALKTFITAAQLSALSIDPKTRPECLSVADFVKITNSL